MGNTEEKLPSGIENLEKILRKHYLLVEHFRTTPNRCCNNYQRKV